MTVAGRVLGEERHRGTAFKLGACRADISPGERVDSNPCSIDRPMVLAAKRKAPLGNCLVRASSLLADTALGAHSLLSMRWQTQWGNRLAIHSCVPETMTRDLPLIPTEGYVLALYTGDISPDPISQR